MRHQLALTQTPPQHAPYLQPTQADNAHQQHQQGTPFPVNKIYLFVQPCCMQVGIGKVRLRS